MQKLLVLLWLTIFVTAISGCATVGKVAKPTSPDVCPKLGTLPANLMQPPETEKKVREELFAQPLSATPK